MTARMLTQELHTLITGFTTPPSASHRKLDEISQSGCDAGNRLGEAIRKVETGLHTLRVVLKDGSRYIVEVVQEAR